MLRPFAAAPHPGRPDHHQRAIDLIDLGLGDNFAPDTSTIRTRLEAPDPGHRFVRHRCEKPLRRADCASKSLARLARSVLLAVLAGSDRG